MSPGTEVTKPWAIVDISGFGENRHFAGITIRKMTIERCLARRTEDGVELPWRRSPDPLHRDRAELAGLYGCWLARWGVTLRSSAWSLSLDAA